MRQITWRSKLKTIIFRTSTPKLTTKLMLLKSAFYKTDHSQVDFPGNLNPNSWFRETAITLSTFGQFPGFKFISGCEAEFFWPVWNSRSVEILLFFAKNNLRCSDTNKSLKQRWNCSGGLRSTEVACVLLTQRPRVWFSAFPRFIDSALLRVWAVQKA